jgi:hypothetical protein
MIRALRSLSWNWFLAAYVALVAVLLFAPLAAHAASAPPVIDIPSITVMENVGSAPVVILKTKASSYSKINIATVDGTARAGIDFKPVNVTLTLANNATSTKLPIAIMDNAAYQGSRQFNLKVTVLRFGQLPASYTPITVTINDDELPPAAPPPAPLGIAGEVPITDNFNTAAGLEPTWYGAAPTNRGGVSALSSLTEPGAFRMDCGPGQLLKDDPIILAGQPGASHDHFWDGNTGANAFSNYLTLRTTGTSTCGTVAGAPINRSSYWTPAMMVGPGLALKPDHILTYYKRFPATSPACVGPNARGICVDLPNGVRFVTGYNMKTMTGGPADTRPGQWDYNFMGFNCYGSNDGTVQPAPGAAGNYRTLAEMAAANVCPVGAQLHVSIDAPECWDGNVDNPVDHRGNVAYATGPDFGYGRQCDAAHPYLIPMMSLQYFYNVDANFAKGAWCLSSDIAMGAVCGTTLHIDYWEGWSPAIKATWMTNCINAPRSCSGGDLGNGTAIIGGNTPWPAGWPKQAPVAAAP